MSTGVHPTAFVDPGARLGANVSIGPFTVVGADVEIGDDCRIGSHCVLTGPMRLGRGNVVHSHATLGNDPQVFDTGDFGQVGHAALRNGGLGVVKGASGCACPRPCCRMVGAGQGQGHQEELHHVPKLVEHPTTRMQCKRQDLGLKQSLHQDDEARYLRLP